MTFFFPPSSLMPTLDSGCQVLIIYENSELQIKLLFLFSFPFSQIKILSMQIIIIIIDNALKIPSHYYTGVSEGQKKKKRCVDISMLFSQFVLHIASPATPCPHVPSLFLPCNQVHHFSRFHIQRYKCLPKIFAGQGQRTDMWNTLYM